MFHSTFRKNFLFLVGIINVCFQESLQEINLEGNKITDVAAGTFSDLPSLKSVNLRHNLLRRVSRNSLQLVRDDGGELSEPYSIVAPLTISFSCCVDNVDICCQELDRHNVTQQMITFSSQNSATNFTHWGCLK